MDQPKIPGVGVALLKALFGFCVMGTLAVFVRMTFHQGESYEDQQRDLRLDRLAKLQKADHEKLTGYGWADKAKGIVHIPIEQAMTLTLADLKAKGVAASAVKAEPNIVNVVPPYVQVAPAPAASPSASPAAASPAPTAK
jgi:hypothetical protein